jgi:gluconate 5-dehydrogenase
METGMRGVKGFNPAEASYLEKMDDLTPMHRKVKTTELVGAIIYYLSDASSCTTGTDILVDGGYCIW